jgi:hypothetical protein
LGDVVVAADGREVVEVRAEVADLVARSWTRTNDLLIDQSAVVRLAHGLAHQRVFLHHHFDGAVRFSDTRDFIGPLGIGNQKKYTVSLTRPPSVITYVRKIPSCTARRRTIAFRERDPRPTDLDATMSRYDVGVSRDELAFVVSRRRTRSVNSAFA